MISATHYLTLAAILFAIGTVGVITRRNVITMFMCVELMLNAVNLTFITFSRFLDQIDGQIFVLMVITVAAAEVAVGLGILLSMFRNRDSVNVEEVNLLKW